MTASLAIVSMIVIGIILIYATWKSYTAGSVPLTMLFIGTLLNLIGIGWLILLIMAVVYFVLRQTTYALYALVMIPVTILTAAVLWVLVLAIAGGV